MDPTAIQAGAPPQSPPDNGAAIQAGLPDAAPAEQPAPRRAEKPLWRQTLEQLASLKLTVVLFVFAILLTFYGSIAQTEVGTWGAVKDYFRCFRADVPLEVVLCYVNYFPKLFNPDLREPLFTIPQSISILGGAYHIPLSVPFPGGWLLGTLMMVNLLAAHAVRFKLRWERAGILVLHAGIILLMVGEVITGLYQVEGTMSIVVNESSNWTDHRDTPELALTREASAEQDQVVAFRGPLLEPGTVLQDERLPFRVRVDQFMINADLKEIEKGDRTPNPATAGVGLKYRAGPLPKGRGMDDEQDYAAAYVTLLDPKTDKALNTYLVSAMLTESQWVKEGGQPFQLALRFKRQYRPYTFHLENFEFKKHPGTDKARDFRSHVHIVDPSRNEDRKVQIYMNHPLRYHGETFYQYQAGVRGHNGTVLQVVRNPAWTLPYVACLVVGAGMLVHFGLNLVRFLERRAA